MNVKIDEIGLDESHTVTRVVNVYAGERAFSCNVIFVDGEFTETRPDIFGIVEMYDTLDRMAIIAAFWDYVTMCELSQ